MSKIIKEATLSFDDRSSQVWALQNQQWVAENWYLSLAIGGVYLAIVFAGRTVMNNRRPFDLRPVFFAWNFGLTIFSTLGAWNMFPEMLQTLRLGGFKMSVCDNGYMLRGSAYTLWAWFFVASKVVELGDTMFIVLTKKPLKFLHWFHHMCTMIGVSYSYATGHGVGRWVVCMNYGIHSFMYAYYTLKTIKVHIPKGIAVVITSMQIGQMFLGFALSLWALGIYQNGEPCDVTLKNSMASIILYMIYFFLFVKFFRAAYVKPKHVKEDKAKN